MLRKGLRARANDNALASATELSAARISVQRRPYVLQLMLCLCLAGGCSSLKTNKESVVHVEPKRNTARANRLTYAGIRSLNKGEITFAAKRFREAVRADRTYGPAHNNLGLMHYEQGNLYQAVLAFEQARQYLPKDPAVVYNLGIALEAAGQIDEALDLYYTAVEMDRANPNFLGNLCRLRVRQGDRDEILRQQLQDLVLIETRPDWRRWADIQLGLSLNYALDRGPETPDFETAANDSSRVRGSEMKDKIIDLTSVEPVTYESDTSTPLPIPPQSPEAPEPASPMILDAPQPQADIIVPRGPASVLQEEILEEQVLEEQVVEQCEPDDEGNHGNDNELRHYLDEVEANELLLDEDYYRTE